MVFLDLPPLPELLGLERPQSLEGHLVRGSRRGLRDERLSSFSFRSYIDEQPDQSACDRRPDNIGKEICQRNRDGERRLDVPDLLRGVHRHAVHDDRDGRSVHRMLRRVAGVRVLHGQGRHELHSGVECRQHERGRFEDASAGRLFDRGIPPHDLESVERVRERGEDDRRIRGMLHLYMVREPVADENDVRIDAGGNVDALCKCESRCGEEGNGGEQDTAASHGQKSRFRAGRHYHRRSLRRKNATRGLMYDRSMRISIASMPQRRKSFVLSAALSCHQRAYLSRTLRSEASTHTVSPVSASMTRIRPTGGSSPSLGSKSRTPIRSCFLEAIFRASSYPSSRKSDIRNAMLRFFAALVRYRRPSAMLVPRFEGWKSSTSLTMRSVWVRPFLGGMNFSITSLKKMTPTLSLF